MSSRHHPEYGACNRCPRKTDIFYCEAVDEYLCEECIMLVAEEQADTIDWIEWKRKENS